MLGVTQETAGHSPGIVVTVLTALAVTPSRSHRHLVSIVIGFASSYIGTDPDQDAPPSVEYSKEEPSGHAIAGALIEPGTSCPVVPPSVVHSLSETFTLRSPAAIAEKSGQNGQASGTVTSAFKVQLLSELSTSVKVTVVPAKAPIVMLEEV